MRLGRHGSQVLLLAILILLGGCATTPHRGTLASLSGGAGGFPEPTRDLFQRIQGASGLEEVAHHPVGAALSPARARWLLGQMATTPVTQRTCAPRQALSWLLREVIEGHERVDYADLRWRAERFEHLVLVRPDGYLVAAHDGTPLQRQGEVRLKRGEWKVGNLAVGGLYVSQGGVFYAATDALRRGDGVPLGELGLGRDPLNAALDGAEDAVGEMAVALGQTFLHPIRSLADLVQLPHTLAALLADSPEYFARYKDMSQQDQIREAARLSTHLVMLLRGGQVAASRLGGWGATLPVLSLNARGELMLGGAVVEGSATTATVGLELGALSVLMAAQGQGGGASGKTGNTSQTPATPGPGRWTYRTPTTESTQARDYQEQVTGRPAWWVYMVGEVEFDGFNGKELLEAKGASYKKFLTKNGTAQPWFEAGAGFKSLMDQAEKQSKLAKSLNLPVVWHVAEAEFATFLRKLFARNNWDNIDVRHTPPAP